MSTTASPATPADQVAQLVEELHAAIAARMQDDPVIAGILTFVFLRVTRLRDRLVRLAALLRAGKWQRIRAPRPHAAPAGTARVRNPTRWPRNARAIAELLGNGTSVFAERLRALLADPKAAAYFAGNAALRRHLRLLCRILGVRLTPELRLPRTPRPRTPRPRTRSPSPNPAPAPASAPASPAPAPPPSPADPPGSMQAPPADLTPWTLEAPAPASAYKPAAQAAAPALSPAEREARLRMRMRVFRR